MDFSIFEKTDLNTRFKISQIEKAKINVDDNVVLIRGLLGGSDGRQYAQFNSAMSSAIAHYSEQNIKIISEMLTNDTVKNVLKWGPTELTDKLLEADAHIMVTHFTEGNIAKTASWNVPNILSNLSRLKYHTGNTMGDRNQCPVLRQGKKEIYSRLPDYCLPTLIVDMPLDEGWDGTLSVAVMDEIKRCESKISQIILLKIFLDYY
jgi:hypothetical protein